VLIAFCAVLGLLVGSFLNVVVARVPAGESVVHPRSRCPRCGHPIRGTDNVPVLSWLLLRGRCRDCGEPISVRYPLVEAATGAAFGGVAAWLGPDAALPAFLYLAAISIALALIDLDVHRLPDAIVKPSWVVAPVLLAVPLVLDRDGGSALRAAIGAAAVFALYWVLWFVRPGGMGWGDVKLAPVLGLYLGYLSWGHLAFGSFAGFLLGGVVGVALMAAGRAGRKSKIPYGPFMLAGVWTAVAFAGPVVHAYLRATGIA
jgi:leader peptidase (prepilin peptidase)/N-methyltransferase